MYFGCPPTIAFTSLSEPDQKRYGYDPRKARKYVRHLKSQAKRASLRQLLADNAFVVGVFIEQVVADGALGRLSLNDDYYKTRDPPPKPLWKSVGSHTAIGSSELFFISGIGKGLWDGTTWEGTVYRAGTHSYINTMGAWATVRKVTALKWEAIEYLTTARPVHGK